MNKYLLFLAVTIMATLPYSAKAEGPVVDPTITPTWTITCTDPIEREDGTPLAVSEIATRNFYVSADRTSWTEAGTNTNECKQVYNLSTVVDGQYYYTATAVDTDGRESVYSQDIVALQVKRLAPPKAPAGLSGAAS